MTSTLSADIDLYLQRRNGDGLDSETLGTNNLNPGYHRLEVHNWAGRPVIRRDQAHVPELSGRTGT